ncbi:hypothetical protein B0H19DRAFT_1104818 [Mycena capillaripes]|nr:hypothetical protein B0H19DRAFT_1104818 [Mycena capillaripes]
MDLVDDPHQTDPALGQGAAQAVDDAAVLSHFLPLGTTRADIPARLVAYQALRKDRAELTATESHDQIMVPSERRKYFRALELKEHAMGYGVLKEGERPRHGTVGSGQTRPDSAGRGVVLDLLLSSRRLLGHSSSNEAILIKFKFSHSTV